MKHSGSNASHSSLLDSIVSYDNLQKAWVKAYHHAKTQDIYFDALGYQIFEVYLETNLRILANDIKAGEYRPSPIRYATIPKGESTRKLYFTEPRDSVAIQAIINIIGPLFELEFSEASYGNRLNVDSQESRNTYRRWPDQYDGYAAKIRSFLSMGGDAWYLITDIENFYPSINRARLLGIVASYTTDEEVIKLLKAFLDLSAFDSNDMPEDVPGLPAGTIYAHFLANIYLIEFDRLATRLGKGFVRYVDDICILFENEQSLMQGEAILRMHLEQWGNHFKPEKSIRSSIQEPDQLIEHTRKLKYAERIDITEMIDIDSAEFNSIRNAEHYFAALYRIAEQEGNTERLVKEAASLAIQLRDIHAENLSELIYSLLESQNLKPSTLKVVLSILLEEELPSVSSRFLSIVDANRPNSSYLRLMILQLIPLYTPTSTVMQALLRDEFTRDPHYLVRAGAYIALKYLAEKRVLNLTLTTLSSLRASETSNYVLARLVNCYSVVASEEVWMPLIRAASLGSHEVSISVIFTFDQLLENGNISPTLLDSIIPALVKPNDSNK